MKAFLFRALLTSGAALLSSNGAAAQVRPDSAVLSFVGQKELRELVLAHGDTVDSEKPLDEPSVRGLTKDGIRYLLIAAECPRNNTTTCTGIMMQVRYTADDKVTHKGITEANAREAAVGTWWDEQSKIVGFTRFVYLSGGVTWGNLKSNLTLLLSASKTAGGIVWQSR